VAQYLRKHNVDRLRVDTKGFGETNPIAENTTDAGREKNRRVEVAIMANEELKKRAEKGEISKL